MPPRANHETLVQPSANTPLPLNANQPRPPDAKCHELLAMFKLENKEKVNTLNTQKLQGQP